MDFFGDDDDSMFSGVSERLGLGEDSVDPDQVWTEVKDSSRTLDRQANRLESRTEKLRNFESNEFADAEEIADIAQSGAENAGHLVIGAKTALNANADEALTHDETYERVDSVHGKVQDLAESVDDAYESAVEYGENTYDQFKEVLEDNELGVDVELPENIDWSDSTSMGRTLQQVSSAYSRAETKFRNEARTSSNKQEKTEERAEKYEQFQQDVEDSPFSEDYEQMAETLREKAETDEPLTAAEKAQKASDYSSIAEYAASHISSVVNAVSNLKATKQTAYELEEELDTVIEASGYRDEQEI